MSRILLGGKPVDRAPNFGHAYLVYEVEPDVRFVTSLSSSSIGLFQLTFDVNQINTLYGKATETDSRGFRGLEKEIDLGGRSADDVWNIIVQAATSIALQEDDIEYRPLPVVLDAQNSNTFVASLLDVVGLDFDDSIPLVRPPFPGKDALLNVDYNIIGGPGNDIIGGPGGDIDLGPIADRFDFGGEDFFVGMGGDDSLSGGFQNDRLFGGSGADSLRGGAGEDTIDGGADDDFLAGGTRNDVFQVSGTAEGFDHYDGGDGFDRIRAIEAGTTIGIRSIQNIEQIEGRGDTEIVAAPEGAQLLLATTIPLGIALIRGQAGDDVIFGTIFNDTITGGGGNDELNGGLGPGSDTFLVAGTADGFDRYADFGAFDTDVIRATELGTVIGLRSIDGIERIEGVGDTQVLAAPEGAALDFTDVGLVGISQIGGQGGVDTIIGSSDNDTIIGGDGDDSLNGGARSDTFLVFGTADGFDNYVGGDGRDVPSRVPIVDTIRATFIETVIGLRSIQGIERIEGLGDTQIAIASEVASIDFTGVRFQRNREYRRAR